MLRHQPCRSRRGAFAANLFTLVIFYEVLSLVTYPLVYHHEDEEGWRGAHKYLVYLMGASKSLLLAALALTCTIAGSLDFRESFGGRQPIGGAADDRLFLLPLRFRQGRGNADARLAACRDGGADAGQRALACSGRRQDGRVLLAAGGVPCLRVKLVGELGLGIATAYLLSFTILMASVSWP